MNGVDDRVSNLLQAGSNITLSYDDANGTLTISSTDTEDNLSNNTTDDLAEGSTNLYYTDARAQAVSINNVSEDASPILGGNLDLNSNDITGSGNIDITGAITLSGDVTGDSGDLNIVNSADGNAIVFKIDDTGGTSQTAFKVKEFDYLSDGAVGSPNVPSPPFTQGGSTATTQYDPYLLVEGGGIKIGSDASEFSSTGDTPDNNSGDFYLNGLIVGPSGDNWPSVNIISTGKSAGMNPVYDYYGNSFGGIFEEYPNAAFLFNAANGLISSPTALGSGKRIGQLAFSAHDGVKYGGTNSVASAAMTVESVETASSSNARAAKIYFEFTKKNGASTDGDATSDRKDTLTMDSDTFTVGASSYPVTTTFNGDATFEDDLIVNGKIDGNTTFDDNVTVEGDLTVNNNVTVESNLTVDNNFTVDGDTTLGNSSNDLITVNGKFDEHLITDNISNLGSSSDRWGFVYAEDLDIDINANIGSDLDVGRDLVVTRNLQVDGSQIDFTNLPTSDPNISGRLWRSGNDVKISTG